MKFDTVGAAKELDLSPKTLQNWRSLGKGPMFLKIGNVIRYDEADLKTFEEECRRKSTSQQAEKVKTPTPKRTKRSRKHRAL